MSIRGGSNGSPTMRSFDELVAKKRASGSGTVTNRSSCAMIGGTLAASQIPLDDLLRATLHADHRMLQIGELLNRQSISGDRMVLADQAREAVLEQHLLQEALSAEIRKIPERKVNLAVLELLTQFGSGHADGSNLRLRH